MQQRIARIAIGVTLFCLITPSGFAAASAVTGFEHPTVAVNASIRITNGVFGRANIVVQNGGTLTIINRDAVDYSLKIGATKVTVKAKNTRTIPLPQRGVFSITCAKFPALRATLTVK